MFKGGGVDCACRLELRWVITDMASFRLVGGFGGQCGCGLNC